MKSFIHPSLYPTLRYLVFSILVLIFFLLVLSVIRSGYSYTFDADELFHTQYAYLLGEGQMPYKDFYASVYTPLFASVLLPVLTVFGKTFSSLSILRILMIAFFLLRTAITGIIVKKLFGKRISAIFLLLFFLDPFTVFVAMQVRPDNLMMLFFSLALLYLLYACEKKKHWLFFLTGLALGLSLLSLIKILPAVLSVLCVVSYFLLKEKQKTSLFLLLEGTVLPLLCFALFTILQGSFGSLVQQMILDPAKSFTAFTYQIPLGNFYWFNNIYIFGAPGKPASWIFAWTLLFLAMAGAHALATKLIESKKPEYRQYVKFSLLLMLLVYQISFFFVNNLYIQYYLPVSYLYAIMGAVAIESLLSSSETVQHVRTGMIGIGTILAFLFTIQSISLNTERSTMVDWEKSATYEQRLKTIKPTEAVFPAFLFRPLAFPMLYGYFLQPSEAALPLLSRYTPIESYLEKEKVPYVLLNDYTIKLLPPSTQEYITSHYNNTDPSDEELLTRIQ